eukprot:TRINITY_DN9906_c0_g1_i1.p3 TRINITY_DN9906_c0_g1~~TRINITY_DN9906_c0_g1_i1.p3  ORF type:complete len:139 (-),score=3.21 TRINITY_DN9906_c0_g1_i1:299-664(-)
MQQPKMNRAQKARQQDRSAYIANTTTTIMSLNKTRQLFNQTLFKAPALTRGYLAPEKIPPHVFKVLKVKYPEMDHEFMYMDMRQYDNPIGIMRMTGMIIFTCGLAIPLSAYYYSGRKKELV